VIQGTEVSAVPSVDLVQAALEAILARPEYAPPRETWLDRVREQLAEWRDGFLSQLLDWFGLGALRASDLGPTLGLVLLVLLLALGARIALRVAGRERSRTRLAADGAGAAELDTGSPDQVLARARQAAAEGRYGAAIALLYAGALAHLDGRGELRFARAKTPREYERELTSSTHRRHWRSLVREFEPVTFGGRAADAARYAAMRREADALEVPQ
jgi:hypothetical protein